MRQPLGDQLVGEIIEQFRMAGVAAVDAEVVGRLDDALAEVILPDAVDQHPLL